MPWKFLTLRPLASCAKTFLSLHLHKTVAKLLPNPARKLACGSTQDQNNINIIILISIYCQIFRDFPTYWVQSKIGFRESFFWGRDLAKVSRNYFLRLRMAVPMKRNLGQPPILSSLCLTFAEELDCEGL